MPVDVTLLLTKSDHKLIARAGRRSKKAADEMIKRIADPSGENCLCKESEDRERD
jgi:hypothetical protein